MSRVAESISGEEGGVGGVRGGEEVGRQEAGRGGLRRRRAGRGMETMHYYRVYCTLKRKLSCKKYEFILWQHDYKDLVQVAWFFQTMSRLVDRFMPNLILLFCI